MTKQILFEYIVFSILKKKIDLNNNLSWDDINNNNDFNLAKLSLIPFFVCIANGHDTRVKLFTIFNSFETDESGIIESDLKLNIIPVITNFIVTENKITITSAVLNAFSNSALSISQALAYFPQDETSLSYYSAVDKSIGVLCKRTDDKFIDFNTERLSIDSKKHSIYEIYKYFIKGAINRDHLWSCKSIYAPEKDLLQITL